MPVDLAAARMMRARPLSRLMCPSGEHGPGVVLYVRGAEGWCGCGRKLRPLTLTETIRDGRTVEKEAR